MAIYHFNLADGSRELDRVGSELADIETARLEAVRFAAEVAKDRPHAVWMDGSLQVEVADERGMILLLVTMIVTNAPAAN